MLAEVSGTLGLKSVTFRKMRFGAEALTDLAMTSLTTIAIYLFCTVQRASSQHTLKQIYVEKEGRDIKNCDKT